MKNFCLNCRQRYLYWLVIAKSCAETEEFSVSAQLNEFNLYYSELFIQAIPVSYTHLGTC